MGTITLEEETFERMTVDECGRVSVQVVTRLMHGDEVVTEKYHRYVISPDDDISDQPDSIRDIVEVARSSERLERYRASR